MACREAIEPGHRYIRTAMLFDGRWDHMKHCVRCSAMLVAIQTRWREAGEDVVYIDAHLDCGESWADLFGEPPPEIQALAFALPGECTL
jgi:hypothetical protein